MPLKRYHYGVRICPEPVYWGGLSGSPYSEAISWGKFVPPAEGGKFGEVFVDATVGLPLIVAAVLERLEKTDKQRKEEESGEQTARRGAFVTSTARASVHKTGRSAGETPAPHKLRSSSRRSKLPPRSLSSTGRACRPRRLRHIRRAHDLVRDAVDFFLLVPRPIRIEFHVQRGGEHFRRQFFSVFAGRVFGFAERVMFAQVAVGVAVRRNSHSDTGGQQAMRFMGGILRHHGKHDFTRMQRYFNPCERGISLHCGGKIDETRTKFCAAIPASRSASSNDVSRSLCFPTPLVKKIRLGTMSLPNSLFLRLR